MKEALFYKKLGNEVVHCTLCPHFCTLKNSERGKCRARENQNGKLVSLVYSKVCSMAVDPIEKKPFYHFFPGDKALSIATPCCNLKCMFCQNCEISQAKPGEVMCKETNPSEVVKQAEKLGIKIIAYTYTEPLIAYEYVLETAKLAKRHGIKNVIVSNGFINQEPLKKLCKYLDAANIDLKSIDDKFYQDICKARVGPVLETLKTLKRENVWTEITNLIIPTLNDSKKNIEELIMWIMESLGRESVLHFTAFYPCYQLLNLPPTPVLTLKKARKIAMDKGMRYVYTGNIPNDEGDNTYCHNCGKLLIKRRLFQITENNLNQGKCPNCNEKITGVWH